MITPSGVEFTDYAGGAVAEEEHARVLESVMAEKAGYKHFMLKEIFEQPIAIKETVLGRASVESGKVFLQEIEIPNNHAEGGKDIVILACGTSWHAALVGKLLIESLARVPVDVDYGSEYATAIRSCRRTRWRSSCASRAKQPTRSQRCGKSQEGGTEHRHLQHHRQHGDAPEGTVYARGPGNRRGLSQASRHSWSPSSASAGGLSRRVGERRVATGAAASRRADTAANAARADAQV